MPSVAHDAEQGGPARQPTPCSILGGCHWAELPVGTHTCPACAEPVHNLCHQGLRRDDDAPDAGFLCGGHKCRKAMSAEEVRLALPSGASGPPLSGASSDPCSAGSNCCAKPGQISALTSQCQHGQPRHFACTRAPCPEDCGSTTSPTGSIAQASTRGGEEQPLLVDADEEATAQAGAAGEGIPAKTAGNGKKGNAGAATRSSSASAGSSTPTGRRASTRNRIAKAVATPEPSLGTSADEAKQLVERLVAGVTDAKASAAVSAAILKNSATFVNAAKDAGATAVTTSLNEVLKKEGAKLVAHGSTLAVAWKSSATEWKKAAKETQASALDSFATKVTDAVTLAVKTEVAAALSAAQGSVRTETNGLLLPVTNMFGTTCQFILDQVNVLATNMEWQLGGLRDIIEAGQQGDDTGDDEADVPSPLAEVASPRRSPRRSSTGSIMSTGGGVKRRGNHQKEPSRPATRETARGRRGGTKKTSHGAGQKRSGYEDGTGGTENTPPSKRHDGSRRSPKERQGNKDRDAVDSATSDTASRNINPNILSMLTTAVKEAMEQNNQAGGSQTATDGGSRAPGGVGPGNSGAGSGGPQQQIAPSQATVSTHQMPQMHNHMPQQVVGMSGNVVRMPSHMTGPSLQGGPQGAYLNPFVAHHAGQGHGFYGYH